MSIPKGFDQFAKGKRSKIKPPNTCVIYTRVSTKEQADNNLSLDIQRKASEQFAKKKGFQIMAYFGGTYESAKTDERKEFNNMLSFVKKSRTPISYIIVYSVDRFSRSGANAIYIADQLKQQNISLLSVTQPTDITTPSGLLQQNIQFIFSQYDNQLRREKAVAGIKNKLLMGDWCVKPPMGYDIIRVNGKKSIVVNKEGDLIRKAFLWSYYEKVPASEIVDRLKAMGLRMYKQRVHKILRNPFYCGLISNSMLEGKIVKGNHEKMISPELFLAINEMRLQKRKRGTHYFKNNPGLPLRGLLYCCKCGQKMSGYENKVKNISYYQCRNSCSGIIRNTKLVHQKYMELLSTTEVTKQQKFRLTRAFENNRLLDSVAVESLKSHKSYATRIANEIEAVEKQFAIGEIPRALHTKHIAKLKETLDAVKIEMDKARAGLLVKEQFKNQIQNILSDLPVSWQNGDLKTKQIIQTAIFPEGLIYSRENDLLSAPMSPQVT